MQVMYEHLRKLAKDPENSFAVRLRIISPDKVILIVGL